MTTSADSTDRRLGYTRGHLDRTALTTDADAPLRFVASSTGVNRYGFSLRNEGWLLTHYDRNPVFLWAHDASQPPIGRAPAMREGGELVANVTFDRDDAFAARVESKYRRGFLSCVSVGWDFVNHDGSQIDDPWRLSPDRMRDDCFYDLAEISGVPVPGDPRALVQQQRKALSLLGRDLVGLFDEQEHGTATVEEIRAGVHAELARLGVQIPAGPPPDPTHQDPEPEATAEGIDSQAAELVLAAFAFERNPSSD